MKPQKTILTVAVFALAFVGMVFVNPAQVQAGADPGLQKIFDTQICPALKKIHGQKLSGNCKDYANQKELDAAVKKICDKYGQHQLKSQCQAYAAAKAPPPSPPSKPTGDPAITCTADNCDLIAKYVNPAINLFSLVFGLVAVISLILGGIQYSASEGDPQKTAQAKNRLYSTLIAIFAYLFLYAFLQFLIPGGAFK